MYTFLLQGGVRIADTVRWFPHNGLKMPVPSKEALLQATLEDLKATLKSTIKNNILPPEGTNSRDILLQLNDIFKNRDKRAQEAIPSPAPTPTPTTTPTAIPRVVPAQAPTPVPTTLPRVVPAPAPTQCQLHFQGWCQPQRLSTTQQPTLLHHHDVPLATVPLPNHLPSTTLTLPSACHN